MIRFPAFCPNCGFVFQSAIQIENSQGITFQDLRQTCPQCGSLAEIPDGTFNVVDQTIEVISASGLTRARLEQLAAILDEARQGERSSHSAFEAVKDAAPTLGSLVDRLSPRMQQALIVFLWFVIQTLVQQGIYELRDDSATRQDVRQAVEAAVERVSDD